MSFQRDPPEVRGRHSKWGPPNHNTFQRGAWESHSKPPFAGVKAEPKTEPDQGCPAFHHPPFGSHDSAHFNGGKLLQNSYSKRDSGRDRYVSDHECKDRYWSSSSHNWHSARKPASRLLDRNGPSPSSNSQTPLHPKDDASSASADAGRPPLSDSADVSKRASVARPPGDVSDLAAEGGSDISMDLDNSGGGGSDSEISEEAVEKQFQARVHFWKGEVEKVGWGGQAFLDTRKKLPCLVCQKYSNTVQTYGFRALLQHAETYKKLEPSQHAAFGEALKKCETEAEGGGAIVPATKRMRVSEPPPKVWPPVVVVENLRTGVRGGQWDGVKENELKEVFGRKWPIQKVTGKWRGDGHAGVALLQFEETCYAFDRAQELDQIWRTKHQGREDWEGVRPPRKRHGETIQQEHDTWQQYSRGLVEEDGSRRLFCYVPTMQDMERLEGAEKGKKWRAITGEELEARRQREKSSALESSLEHAKTRLVNEKLKERNAALQSQVEGKDLELQTIRLERAQLNEQQDEWKHQWVARLEQEHREEKLAAQKKVDAEREELERQLSELHQKRREDHTAMAKLKREAETRELRLRHVFETGLKEIDQEYNEKEKAMMERVEEELRRDREKLKAEKEAATRSLLEEQAEKMQAIERERARAQELMEEARQLRESCLERERQMGGKMDESDECGICMEPWSDKVRRAVLGCGHAMYCKPCAESYFESDRFKPDKKGKRPPFECPLGHKLGRNKKAIELYL